MSWRALGISILALSSFGAAEARPVSYPGGWTVMQHNNTNASSLHVHYSPTFQDSIGFYAESNWTYDWTFQGVQYNRLLKRWNTENSQANVYVKPPLVSPTPSRAVIKVSRASSKSLATGRRAAGSRLIQHAVTIWDLIGTSVSRGA